VKSERWEVTGGRRRGGEGEEKGEKEKGERRKKKETNKRTSVPLFDHCAASSERPG